MHLISMTNKIAYKNFTRVREMHRYVNITISKKKLFLIKMLGYLCLILKIFIYPDRIY